jgi:hypothetical protein
MSETQPKGKILKPDGTDVSDRDRSDDGTIIVRKNREPGHNYFFGQNPDLSNMKTDCPKCGGCGFVTSFGKIETMPVIDDVHCDLCDGKGRVKVSVRKKYLRSQNEV